MRSMTITHIFDTTLRFEGEIEAGLGLRRRTPQAFPLAPRHPLRLVIALVEVLKKPLVVSLVNRLCQCPLTYILILPPMPVKASRRERRGTGAPAAGENACGVPASICAAANVFTRSRRSLRLTSGGINSSMYVKS